MKRSQETNALILIGIIGLVTLFGVPLTLDLYSVISLTTAVSLAILALSLGLIWGFGGILCFGQTVFFGIGGYAYAIAALNLGGSAVAIIVAVLVAAAAAVFLGYFMFYGRLSDVYLAVITLTVTLILYSVIRRTSGPEYKIGIAKIGGFNGINVPPINYPWDVNKFLYPEDFFYVAMVALLVTYFFCVWLTKTHFGRVSESIRENEVRTELLGYDVRIYKLCMFTIGGAIAGLAGTMFANSIGRITPDVFNLYNAALTIIWVIIGGRGTLIGPVLGALIFFYITSLLGQQNVVNINLFLGLVLIIFVLVVPKGIVPSLVQIWVRRRSRRLTAHSARRMRRRGRSRVTEVAVEE